jgi:hypothetical protein
VQRPSDERRFKSGHYGAGTLWYHSTREGIFIAFNGVRIAKRGRDAETWAAVEGGWKVTPVGRAELKSSTMKTMACSRHSTGVANDTIRSALPAKHLGGSRREDRHP